MGNTYTDNLKLRQPALGDTGWDDELNDNTAILEVLLAAMQKGNGVISGLAPSDGGGLDVDYAAGSVVANGARKAISASSKACTANLKNWLYVDSSGTTQISTTAPSGQYVPIAMIDAGASSIDRIADLRILPRTPAVNKETLTGTKALAAGDICTRQILDPGGADRDVLLPPEAEGWLIVYNSADAAENLTLKDDSDTDTIATVPQGGGAILLCDGTTWVKLENLKFTGNVVFDGSVSTNVIAATNLVGMIAPFAMSTPPTGWLECNGAAVSRTTYAALFAAISDDYGNGDGSTTFNIPDFRGQFLRGWDHGATTDPDAASRTDRGDGTTGDYVGTKQADRVESHAHAGVLRETNGSEYRADSYVAATSGELALGNSATGSHTTDSYGGSESRPTNINVMFCIKY